MSNIMNLAVMKKNILYVFRVGIKMGKKLVVLFVLTEVILG